jgi:hypothetical protein
MSELKGKTNNINNLNKKNYGFVSFGRVFRLFADKKHI